MNSPRVIMKLYSYGIIGGFSLTFTTNLSHNLIFNYDRKYRDPHVNENQLNIYSNPSNFVMENLEKSIKFGLFWPVIPFVICKEPRVFYNIYGKYPPSFSEVISNNLCWSRPSVV